jgi:LacI family transcriptional regulator
MKPTIKMIADYAGVSRGVVDRVLHGRPNVNPSKRKRVEDTLKKLNYTPDLAARALALKNKAMKVAIVLPRWPGSFNTEVPKGIEAARQELSEYRIEVLVEWCKTELPEECIAVIDSLLAKGVNGLAICANNSEVLQRKLRLLTRKDFPVVTFNSDIPESGRICFVGQDDFRSGRVAGEIMAKMLPRGSQTLITCGNRAFEGHQGRVDGFRARWSELGKNGDICGVVETYNDYDTTYRRVREALRGNPQIKALYMANESVPGCVEGLKSLEKCGAIRVVCHDVSETTGKFLHEGAVDFAIEQDLYHQGFLPLTLLGDLLLAGKSPEQDIKYTKINVACAENIF